MKINGEEIDINKLSSDIYDDKSMLKMRGNGIYLSDNDIEVLRRYNIDYTRYISLSSLIFDIEQVLNEDNEATELDEISNRISENKYYNYTKKNVKIWRRLK